MAPLWSVKKEVFKGNPGISSIMDKRLPKTARKCFLHSMYDILFKIVSITDWDWKWIRQAICSFHTERFFLNHVIPWFLALFDSSLGEFLHEVYTVQFFYSTKSPLERNRCPYTQWSKYESNDTLVSQIVSTHCVS